MADYKSTDLLTARDIRELWGISESTFWRLVDAPKEKFPKPVKRPIKKPQVWLYADLEAFKKKKGWA